MKKEISGNRESAGKDERVIAQAEISPLCLWKDAGWLAVSLICFGLAANPAIIASLFDICGIGEDFDVLWAALLRLERQLLEKFGFSASLVDNPLLIPAFAFIVAAAGKLVLKAVSWQFSRVLLTSRRVIYRTGALARKIGEIRCAQVESVSLGQNVLERPFGIGNIDIRGTGGGGFEIPYLKDAVGFRERLNDAAANAREMERM